MDQGFIDILKQLVKEQGNAALSDIKRCKALLADYTKNEYKKESRLIVQAVEFGVAKAIDGTDNLVACKKAQISELEDEYSINSETAQDIVNAFALVLRGDTTITVSPSAEKAAGAYFNRGIAYQQKGIYDNAMADYAEAIRHNPNLAGAYANRGMAYKRKGDYDRAIADYTQAIRLDPNDALTYSSRGNMYRDKCAYDQAIADYTQVIRLNPNNAYAYYDRGVAYQRKGNNASAEADIARAKELGYRE
jgi:tetratricopeptide (TPR) repeat protein